MFKQIFFTASFFFLFSFAQAQSGEQEARANFLKLSSISSTTIHADGSEGLTTVMLRVDSVEIRKFSDGDVEAVLFAHTPMTQRQILFQIHKSGEEKTLNLLNKQYFFDVGKDEFYRYSYRNKAILTFKFEN